MNLPTVLPAEDQQQAISLPTSNIPAMRWAEAHPRSITQFTHQLLQLATLDEETAQSCTYALPRKDKQGKAVSIEGPSVRYAELVQHSWGHCDAFARIIEETTEFVRAQGLFVDHERNTRSATEVVRRIVDSSGRRFSGDMIAQTSNAACSIARRDAILQGIPRVFWGPSWSHARKLAAGDAKSLANKRVEALKAFAAYGIVEADILRVLEVPGVADITIDHLQQLRETLVAIRDGIISPEEAFAEPQQPKQTIPAALPGVRSGAEATTIPAVEVPARGGRLRKTLEARRRQQSDSAGGTLGSSSATSEPPAPPADPATGKSTPAERVDGGERLTSAAPSEGAAASGPPELWEPTDEEAQAILQREIEQARAEAERLNKKGRP